MVKTKFLIDNVRWLTRPSRELHEYEPPSRVRLGLSSAIVTCRTCGANWRARSGRGPGLIRPVVGGHEVECLTCGAQGPVALE